MYERPLRSDELMHFGVLGMHWGIRRYQPYPKNYTGDGREVGEARRVQDSIRRDIVNDSYKTTVNLRRNPNIRLASQKAELLEVGKERHDKMEKQYAIQEEIVSDTLKKKKLDPSSEEAYEERERLTQVELNKNRKKYPKYDKSVKEFEEADKKYYEVLKNITNELLGNLGNVPISKSEYSGDVKDIVADVLEFKNASYMDKLDKVYKIK